MRILAFVFAVHHGQLEHTSGYVGSTPQPCSPPGPDANLKRECQSRGKGHAAAPNLQAASRPAARAPPRLRNQRQPVARSVQSALKPPSFAFDFAIALNGHLLDALAFQTQVGGEVELSWGLLVVLCGTAVLRSTVLRSELRSVLRYCAVPRYSWYCVPLHTLTVSLRQFTVPLRLMDSEVRRGRPGEGPCG
eukprot:3127143-Rhodomonas_salina.1